MDNRFLLEKQSGTVSASDAKSRIPMHAALALAVLLELLAPFFAKSYGVDGQSQLNLLGQFTTLVAHGVLFPRWAPQGVAGFGIGSFYFYPPVAFYMGSLIRFLTAQTDVHFLFQMTGLLATVLSFFATRPLLRALGASRYSTNIGALLYAFAPFQIAELYSRSSLSSHVGYMFVPLVWYGVLAIAGRTHLQRREAIVLLAVASALTALSSVPLALATALCIGIVAIACYRSIDRHIIIDAALAGFIASALAAFHFLAVLSAQPFAQLKDLTVAKPEYILADVLRGTDLPAAYHIGIAYLTWIGISVLFFKTKQHLSGSERAASFLTFVVGGFVALLELPFLSQPLFAKVPPFTLIQGCWRFYVQFLIAGSVFVSIAVTPAAKRAARGIVWLWVLGAIGPALLIVFNFHLFHHGSLPGKDPTEYLPIYTIHAQTEGYGKLEAHRSDAPALSDLEAGEHIQAEWLDPISEAVFASLHTSHEVTFHRFYWPYWHLYASSREISSHPDSLGRAVATLPAGNYTATWQLERTPLERAGLWISGISWAAVILFAGIGLVRKRVKRRASLSP